MIFFSTGKRKPFGTIRNLFSFSISQNWEQKFVDSEFEIGETIWWIHYLFLSDNAFFSDTFLKVFKSEMCALIETIFLLNN